MFAVYWRDRPANAKSFFLVEGDGWDNNEFATLEEAQQYVRDWMNDDDLTLEPDKPFDYSGQGHFVEIRTVK